MRREFFTSPSNCIFNTVQISAAHISADMTSAVSLHMKEVVSFTDSYSNTIRYGSNRAIEIVSTICVLPELWDTSSNCQFYRIEVRKSIIYSASYSTDTSSKDCIFYVFDHSRDFYPCILSAVSFSKIV